ncbi:Crp/Fnr family transcriptional regulator [Lacihabitans sp. CCS-44]|uniref:Crp/Fnr family transcriptional regulator n=1 Tax=Lacihabitans sp. CCS-44 TaxID=2487331 RepID=UPI0020CC51D5|nr:cyclic nucleotide-binding domain-containing protein [Lacihabitans sp. CCS-44]MCP9755992.1 Crp/Fnr family transcriptional regulator [Lacihabitans sp. CCS-44]
MEELKAYLKDNSRLTEHNPTEKDWEIILSKFVRQDFPKKTILTKAGQTENYLNFILKGVARFYIPKEENDLTFNIVFSNGFLSAYDSFLTQKPSTYNIETLTDTTLLRLTYNDLQTIYNETEFGNIIGRQASEELFLKKQKRELSLLNLTAEQRYLNLFSEQPKLIEQIPLKYIASYIGVTPQALSRIRKRIY